MIELDSVSWAPAAGGIFYSKGTFTWSGTGQEIQLIHCCLKTAARIYIIYIFYNLMNLFFKHKISKFSYFIFCYLKC